MKLKELLIVFGTVTMVLMITRIVITRFVSPNWLVSFVIMASISLSLLFLAKKGKLGWWGQMFLQQMIKNQHGRRALFVYGISIFFIAIMVGTIYTIHVGDDIRFAGLKHDMLSKAPELGDNNLMMNKLKNTSPLEMTENILVGLSTMPFVVIEEFPIFAGMLSLLNANLHGWILNLYSVSLVEYLEIIGIMLFYRIALRNVAIPNPKPIKTNFNLKINRKRILLFLAFAAIFSIAYQVGTLNQISHQDAKTYADQLKNSVKGIDSIGIFLHNTEIALPMFIPVFGMIWGSIAGASTGFAYKAMVTLVPGIASKIPAMALLYLSPFGIMELVAYSIGMSRSLILANAIRLKQCRQEIRPTVIEIGFVVSLLLLAGFIEFYMISSGQFKVG